MVAASYKINSSISASFRFRLLARSSHYIDQAVNSTAGFLDGELTRDANC